MRRVAIEAAVDVFHEIFAAREAFRRALERAIRQRTRRGPMKGRQPMVKVMPDGRYQHDDDKQPGPILAKFFIGLRQEEFRRNDKIRWDSRNSTGNVKFGTDAWQDPA